MERSKGVVSSERAVSPVIGSMLLVLIGVVMAVAVMGVADNAFTPKIVPRVVLVIDGAEITDSGLQRVTLVHKGGSGVNVSEIKIVTEVNGVLLTHQLVKLPTRCVGVTGYRGVGGVLCKKNAYWTVGDVGWFNIAKSNHVLENGDTVKVSIIHKPSGMIISTSKKQVT